MKDQNPFKEKLYTYTLPVKEDIWNHVEANLPAKRRRLPFLWLALASFLFIGASVLGVTLLHKPLIPVTPKENKSIEDIKNSSTPIAENTITSRISEQPINETLTNKKLNTTNTTTTKTQQRNPYQKALSHTSNHQPSIVSADAIQFDSRAETNSYRKEMAVVNSLNTLDFNPLSLEESAFKMAKIKPDPSCYKFRGKNGKNAISVDVFAGLGFATRKYDATEGATSPYATARNQTEKSKYVWGAGARINLNLKQGFAVRLGISLEQIGDIFNYTDASATQSTTQIDSFFAADGTFLRADTNRVLIFGKLIKKIHNRYTHLDIPLLLSYELPMGRSTLMINAGPVLNLTSSVRGQILDPTLNPVHITAGEPDELKAYKNNLGLSLYLGAGALFPLTDNISAMVEPRLLYRINPVTLDSYPLKEHRSTACLNLGIRYHFN
ncbi:MAG: hypothetical protein ABJB16_02285 [Saprospiraceae bacterium]